VTSNRTIKWIESLADQELSIRSGDRVSIDLCTTKEQVLSAETSTFVRDLYNHADYLVGLFNLRVVSESMQLNISKRNGHADGFEVSRSGMKLNVLSLKPGVIQLQCERLSSPSTPTRSNMLFSGTIEADFVLFHEVEWSFLGSKVVAEQVARHYLTEFIQVSRPADS
jgi:hypothetical protein